MRKLFLKIVTKISVFLTRVLIWRYKLKIITVAGSVGKTGTKHVLGDAIATKIPTIFQKGSFNQPFSIPFAIFGLEYSSSPTSIIFWIKSWLKMLSLITSGYEYGVAVVEVGSDHPGDIAMVTKWLKPDYAVLTAVSEEHMANFRDLDEVAAEEFGALNAKLKNFVAGDSVSKELRERYLKDIPSKGPVELYGFESGGGQVNLAKMEGSLKLGAGEIKFKLRQPASYLAEPFLVAAEVMHELKFSNSEIEKALESVSLPPGRLQIFEGINGSVIVDDTYNASPAAYQKAIELVYKLPAKRRFLVLGNMNEFGVHSKKAHQDLDKILDLSLSGDYIITVGPDINKYLYPKLKALGSKNLFKFKDPWSAGEFVAGRAGKGDLVFLKGSQNGVFLEEAAQLLLKNPADAKKLCRQSQHWVKIKEDFRKSVLS